MIDVNSLKAEIVRQGYTQKDVYEGIGLTKRKWTDRMSKAKFDSDDMYKIKKFLNIENPTSIFFAD